MSALELDAGDALIGAAFLFYADRLDVIIDRIQRESPELALGYDSFNFRHRPWFVFDKANGSEVVNRFESFAAAERFAHVHADRCGGTVDFRSFRELGV